MVPHNFNIANKAPALSMDCAKTERFASANEPQAPYLSSEVYRRAGCPNVLEVLQIVWPSTCLELGFCGTIARPNRAPLTASVQL